MSVGNKITILKALQYSELQYGQMVYDYAQLWIQRYFGADAIVVDALNASKSFWQWWNGQWANRDSIFIHQACLNQLGELNGELLTVTRELYADHHSIDELRIVPNRYVVAEVGKLIKAEEAKLKKLKS